MPVFCLDRKSTRLNSSHLGISYARLLLRSEEHTSELQSLRQLVCRLLLRSEEHTSELQSLRHLVCRLLLRKEDKTSELQSIKHFLFRLPHSKKHIKT